MSEYIVCGHLDSLDLHGIEGWAADPNALTVPLRMSVVIDGKLIADILCDRKRLDVAVRGLPSPFVGFALDLPSWCADNKTHEIEFLNSSGLHLTRSDFKVEENLVIPLPQEVWKTTFKVHKQKLERKRRLSRIFLPDATEIVEVQLPAPAVAQMAPGPSMVQRVPTLRKPDTGEYENANQLLITAGVFDSEWYLSTYPDISDAGVDPLEHFCRWGYSSGRRPNPYFDPEWYIAEYTSYSESGSTNPLVHYVLTGEALGYRPIRHFDPVFYRSRYTVPDGVNCLGHYLTNRFSGQFSPISEFDPDYYSSMYPDVAAAKVDLFEHYFTYGFLEWRNPSADFDTRFYRERYLPNSQESPLAHYLRHKDDPGIFPKMPETESTVSRQLKRFARQSPAFEERAPLPVDAFRKAKVLAYFLTQFHPFPENDEWWGKGFTEWTNVARGSPRFIDHFQPRIPRDLGFYSLADKSVMRQQIQLAKEAGLFGFVYYFYWFNGHRLMERPLNAFMEDASLDFPFCLMWANENWTRRWDGADAEVLISQDYKEDDDKSLIDTFGIAFRDPRYIRFQGRPLLMLYRPGIIPDCIDKVAIWRQLFADRWQENPIIIMSQSFGDVDPSRYGLDGAIEFPPHKVVSGLPLINDSLTYLDLDFTAQVYSYDDVVKASTTEAEANFPLIKTLCPSWDNDARRQGSGLVIHGSTPSKYQRWMEVLIEQSKRSPFFGEAVVCVNAWNEWAEGAHLEPDLHFGSAYLNATSRAVAGLGRFAHNNKILLVGHDAFPSGAQQLLLNIGRRLVARFGYEINFLLLDGGKLESSYREIAPTKIGGISAGTKEYIDALSARGFKMALVNTSAAGIMCDLLRDSGYHSTLLVHELPRILNEKKLLMAARTGIENADVVVFPATFVRNEVVRFCETSPRREVILPQGSYKKLTFSPEDRAILRSRLHVGSGEYVVIGVGYADLRKGFDLFLQTWRAIASVNRRFHFWWVGAIDPALENYLSQEIASATSTQRFKMLGFRDDIGELLSAADVFLLSSREDPYPTVVLEAMSVGLPCFGFSGSGGMPETISSYQAGKIVDLGDVPAISRAILKTLGKGQAHVERTRLEFIQTIGSNFSFEKYLDSLVTECMPSKTRVSVVVPNYNYAHYLRGRLRSIFNQEYPVFEIIVLDDVSSDDSIAVVKEYSESFGREVSVIANQKNSGSVFRQWRKAAEVASGDYLWIAEADDMSDPTFLGKLVNAMVGRNDVILAFSDSSAIDSDGEVLWPDHKAYFASAGANALSRDGCYPSREFAQKFMAERNLILNVSCVLWRRKTLLDVITSCEQELLSYKMAGDWYLYVDLMTSRDGTVAFLAEPLNLHRRHASSVTHSLSSGKHLAEIRKVHDFLRSRLGADAPIVSQERYFLEVSKQFSEGGGLRNMT